MAITRKQIIESIHKCALAGDWEFEATLVEKIAKQLHKYQSGDGSLNFNLSFREIREKSGAVAPDTQSDHYKRPDIVLSNSSGRPICVIEVKRNWSNKNKCYEDLERIYQLVDACSHKNGGSLRRGFLLVGRMGVRRETIWEVTEDIKGYSKENFRDVNIRLEVRRSSSLSIEISA